MIVRHKMKQDNQIQNSVWLILITRMLIQHKQLNNILNCVFACGTLVLEMQV